MTVEITPYNSNESSLRITIPAKTPVRLRAIPPNIVPNGCDASCEIDGVTYSIHDFRERPGHEPGAKITGDGCAIKLNEQDPIGEINNNIFLYTQST